MTFGLFFLSRFFFVSVIFNLNCFFLPTFITHNTRTFLFSTYCASISGWKPWQRSCSRRNVSVQKSCFINFGINELSMVKKLVRLWTGNFASSRHSGDSQTIFSLSGCFLQVRLSVQIPEEALPLARDTFYVLLIIDKWTPFELFTALQPVGDFSSEKKEKILSIPVLWETSATEKRSDDLIFIPPQKHIDYVFS